MPKITCDHEFCQKQFVFGEPNYVEPVSSGGISSINTVTGKVKYFCSFFCLNTDSETIHIIKGNTVGMRIFRYDSDYPVIISEIEYQPNEFFLQPMVKHNGKWKPTDRTAQTVLHSSIDDYVNVMTKTRKWLKNNI